MSISKSLKSSKSAAKLGRLHEALHILEQMTQTHPRSELTSKIVTQIAIYCNKLSNDGNKTHFLTKAEHTLINWIERCSQEKTPVKEKVIKLLILTMNNWSEHYKSMNNKLIAVSCLNKHMKLIEDFPIKSSNTLRLVASARYTASSLYIQLKKHRQAVFYAKFAISLLDKDSRCKSDSLALYISCYYNIGVALQFMNQLKESFDAFEIANNHAKSLPSDHYLIPIISGALKKVKSISDKKRTDQIKSERILPPRKAPVMYINSDEYFYNKISSMLQVSEDIKNIPSTPINLIEIDKQERQRINKLRLRKHHKKTERENRSLQDLKNRIAQLKEEDEHIQKLNKTRSIYKAKKLKLMQSEVQDPSPVISTYNGSLTAKETIENIMNELISKPKKKILIRHEFDCQLAKSTQKLRFNKPKKRNTTTLVRSRTRIDSKPPSKKVLALLV